MQYEQLVAELQVYLVRNFMIRILIDLQMEF